MAPATDIQETWTTFLIESELAKNYKMTNMISSSGGPPAPNPILDMLLPSLLYVRLGSLLDEALVEFMGVHGLQLPKGYKNDLNGRITFLFDQGKLKDSGKLQAVRKQRNLLAHRAQQSCTWELLANAIADIHAELQHLAMVGQRPQYEFFGERSAAKDIGQQGKFSQDFRYGLKENGEPVIDVSWTVTFGK